MSGTSNAMKTEVFLGEFGSGTCACTFMQEPPLSPPNLIPSGRPSFQEALMKDTGECVLYICVNELTVEWDGLQLTLSVRGLMQRLPLPCAVVPER